MDKKYDCPQIPHRNKSFIVRQHSKLTKNNGSISVFIGFHLSKFNKISANSNSEILLLSTIQLLHLNYYILAKYHFDIVIQLCLARFLFLQFFRNILWCRRWNLPVKNRYSKLNKNIETNSQMLLIPECKFRNCHRCRKLSFLKSDRIAVRN